MGKVQVYKPGSVLPNRQWVSSIWGLVYTSPRATYPQDSYHRYASEVLDSCCLVLLLTRFAVPAPLLLQRWALTPPFHPYPL